MTEPIRTMNASHASDSSRSAAAHAAPHAAARIEGNDVAGFAATLIATRQSVLPKRLVAPGPDAAQFRAIMEAAAAAPDHGQLLPWRFVVIPGSRRSALAETFARALVDRDPGAPLDKIEAAREKAYRAPLLAIAVLRACPADSPVPDSERLVSLGCALQNLLLMAHAQGFGAGLTSGQAMGSPRMAELLGLAPGERAICCVSIGTVSARKPAKLRPPIEAFVSTLA